MSQLAFPSTCFSNRIIILRQQKKADLCNPSARGRLPARSEQLGVGWLSANACLSVDLLHARSQNLKKGLLFSRDETTAIFESIWFHCSATLDQLHRMRTKKIQREDNHRLAFYENIHVILLQQILQISEYLFSAMKISKSLNYIY